jgi:CRP-like cAMP-binding protein
MKQAPKNTRTAARNWAIAQNLPQTQKSVLGVLARRYSPRWGHCEITQQQIANELGIVRETANRTLSSLEASGIIASGKKRVKGQWDRKFYILSGFQRGLNLPY